MNLAKFLRTLFFIIEHLRWLLLIIYAFMQFKDTHRENAPSKKLKRLRKIEQGYLSNLNIKPNIFMRLLVLESIFSSFSKESFVFQKICFKVKVMKTFKISGNCYKRIFWYLKWRAALEIPSPIFSESLCSLCWL